MDAAKLIVFLFKISFALKNMINCYGWGVQLSLFILNFIEDPLESLLPYFYSFFDFSTVSSK